MSEQTTKFVFDSYAILALLQNENGAGRIKAILEQGERGESRVYFSVINLGEVIYLVERRRGLALAQQTLAMVEALPMEILPATRARVLAAAHLKARFPFAYADAFAAAAAEESKATLVTGDPEFRLIEGRIQVEWLSER